MARGVARWPAFLTTPRTPRRTPARSDRALRRQHAAAGEACGDGWADPQARGLPWPGRVDGASAAAAAAEREGAGCPRAAAEPLLPRWRECGAATQSPRPPAAGGAAAPRGEGTHAHTAELHELARLGVDVKVIKCRFQSKRAQTYIRLLLLAITLK